MHQAKLSTALGLVLAAVLLGTGVDAVLNLGDTFKGGIVVDDEDVVQFAAVAGSKVTLTMKAAKSNVIPQLEMIYLPTGENVFFQTNSGKKKLTVKNIEILQTGMYEVRCTGAVGTIGDYSLKTKEKLNKGVTKPKLEEELGVGEGLGLDFGAKPGYILSGTVGPAKKSEAVAGIPTITFPDDEGGVGVPLTGFFNNKGIFQIADLTLETLGSYSVIVQNEGLTGIMKTSLKLNVKKNKEKKKTVEEGVPGPFGR